jgi:sugar phosphate isomerase/epimerase
VKHDLHRREFLKAAGLTAGAGLLSLACSPRSGAREGQATSAARLFEISLAQWSLHRALRAGQLDPLDFPVVTRREYGLGGAELVNTFYFDRARDRAYLEELQRRAKGEGVTLLLIMCDAEGDLGDPAEAARTKAVENHYKWVEAAAFLGCHSIRVNARSDAKLAPEEQQRLSADGLRRLAEFGDGHGINVIVENHGGLSSNGQWLAGLMKLVDHRRAGTLPDFGNFRVSQEPEEWYDRYRGVAELMPYAKAVSAKSYDFDDAGNCVETDYLRMMRIVLDAGYRGYVGIEYEGDRLSEPEGIHATRALLERVRAELASAYASPAGEASRGSSPLRI